jgi:hypothetical protein
VSASSWQPTVEALATVLAAVGTVAAVAVALFVQPLRERRQAPQLYLQLGEHKAGVGFGPTVRGAPITVTVRVGAKLGRRAAEDVEVLLTAWWSAGKSDASSFVVVDHVPLQWIGSHRAEGPVTQLRIAPGTEREVALLRLGRPEVLEEAGEKASGFGGVVFACGHALEDGKSLSDNLTFGIRLDATSRNADTVSYQVGLRTHQVWGGRVLDPKSGRPAPPTAEDGAKLRFDVYLEWVSTVPSMIRGSKPGWMSIERPEDLELVDDEGDDQAPALRRDAKEASDAS